MSDTLTLQEAVRYGLSITSLSGVASNHTERVIHQPLVKPFRTYTISGRTLTLTEWCKHHNISLSTVCSRLRRGVPLYLALTLPIRDYRQKKTATGGYQPTSPKTTGTGLGRDVVERGDFTTENKTENQPSKAGE